jgi:hypothetical protein
MKAERTFELSLLWKSLQVFARIITALLFDLKVYGRHNIPRGGCGALRPMFQRLRTGARID